MLNPRERFLFGSAHGKATNDTAGAAHTLIMLTLFIFTSGTTVPLQAQADPVNAKVPPVTHNSWSKGTAMPKALKFVMTGVLGGKVYVVGGVTNTAVVTNNQVYNPVTNTWSRKAALPEATCDAASAVVKNVLYVFGGSTDGKTVTNAVWAYNPTTNKWSANLRCQLPERAPRPRWRTTLFMSSGARMGLCHRGHGWDQQVHHRRKL
jgi:N-acetylneuraminic acid mutarotase